MNNKTLTNLFIKLYVNHANIEKYLSGLNFNDFENIVLDTCELLQESPYYDFILDSFLDNICQIWNNFQGTKVDYYAYYETGKFYISVYDSDSSINEDITAFNFPPLHPTREYNYSNYIN